MYQHEGLFTYSITIYLKYTLYSDKNKLLIIMRSDTSSYIQAFSSTASTKHNILFFVLLLNRIIQSNVAISQKKIDQKTSFTIKYIVLFFREYKWKGA